MYLIGNVLDNWIENREESGRELNEGESITCLNWICEGDNVCKRLFVSLFSIHIVGIDTEQTYASSCGGYKL